MAGATVVPPVVRRKLGKHRADGLHLSDATGSEIHIDERLKPKRELEIYVHEFLHEICPEWSEEHVTAQGKRMGDFLWKHGYRRSVKRST